MKKKSIAKNYLFNLIYQMLTILLPLITTPYLSRVLQAEPIGIFGYTMSIVTYFVLFGSLGIAMYGQREIAYHQNNKKEFSKSFLELLLLRFISLLVTIGLFYFIYGREGNYAFYYRILIIQLVASMFDISWFFQGLEEFDKTVIRNLIVKVMSLILIFVLVKNPTDLWKYFAISVGSELIGNLSLFLYLPKYIIKIPIKDLQLKKHIKPTILLFLPQIAIQIYTVLDKTMIGLLTNNMAEVGFYEQAQKVVRAALVLISALQTVMNSRIAAAYMEKNYDEVKNCLKKSFQFVWFLGIPLALGLIAIASKFVPWFYGDGFDGVTNILIFTTPILIAIGLNGITGIQYLVQTGKQNIFTVSVIIGAFTNVLFNMILIPKYGGAGAAIASVAAESVILIYQLHFFKDQFLFRDILKFGVKNIISGVIMLLVVSYVVTYLKVSILNTMIEIFIGMLTYFLMLFILKESFFVDILRQILVGIKRKRG